MGALGAILSVARGVRSGCADLLSIRSNTDPRLGALETEGALGLGVAGPLPDRLGALTAGGLLRTTGACDRLSARGLNDGWNDRDGPGDGADIRGLGDGWNDRDGPGEGADGRELNDWLRPDIDDPMLGPPPPRFPNDGDGPADDRLGAGALGADRDTWLEPPPPPPRLPPPLP